MRWVPTPVLGESLQHRLPKLRLQENIPGTFPAARRLLLLTTSPVACPQTQSSRRCAGTSSGCLSLLPFPLAGFPSPT